MTRALLLVALAAAALWLFPSLRPVAERILRLTTAMLAALFTASAIKAAGVEGQLVPLGAATAVFALAYVLLNRRALPASPSTPTAR